MEQRKANVLLFVVNKSEKIRENCERKNERKNTKSYFSDRMNFAFSELQSVLVIISITLVASK